MPDLALIWGWRTLESRSSSGHFQGRLRQEAYHRHAGGEAQGGCRCPVRWLGGGLGLDAQQWTELILGVPAEACVGQGSVNAQKPTEEAVGATPHPPADG